MPIYHIQPQDLLFFRDARPMEPQSPGGGHGARWPHPAVFFDAIHAALWRAFPKPGAEGFADHSFYRKENGERVPVSEKRIWFQSLATAGPFPVWNAQWLFPAPADVLPNGECLLPITEHQGTSNRPEPLRYGLGATTLFTKESGPPWWSKEAIEAYLKDGHAPARGPTFKSEFLFDEEWTTGIGTNPATDTQDGERIYSAQYLRLRETARLGLWASLPEANGFDGMDRLFRPEDELQIMLAGGQQRACRVKRQTAIDLTALLPVSSTLPAECTRLKWVLLSPAVFPAVPKQDHPGGWLPTWIHPTNGSVLLNQIETAKSSSGSGHRKVRRKVNQPDLLACCRLVAACIPKALPVTGWTRDLHVPGVPLGNPGSPRATLLAVPAGAAYYFEAAGPCAAEATKVLSELLSWHGKSIQAVDRIVNRRSSLLGEKGFGLGVCGMWNRYEDAYKSPQSGL